jgi:histidinol-phosphatase (PHP family)
MSEPILYEQHMHTPLCRHAIGEPEEYAAVAEKRGLKGIVVTCHNPLPNGLSQGVRMYPEQFDEYVAIVERARQAWAGRVDVRLGLECDYWPGLEPFLEKQLQSTEFHHVLGSVHPQIPEYQAQFWHGDFHAFQIGYFNHLADAAETKLFDTLSHPDLVKNVFPAQWGLKKLLPEILPALDRIAAAGTAMELNTSGLLKAIPEMNPAPAILQAMAERGIPVVIGADAHTPTRAAANFEEALDLLEAAGYQNVNFFVHRRRHSVTIEQARSSLQPLSKEETHSVVKAVQSTLEAAKRLVNKGLQVF